MGLRDLPSSFLIRLNRSSVNPGPSRALAQGRPRLSFRLGSETCTTCPRGRSIRPGKLELPLEVSPGRQRLEWVIRQGPPRQKETSSRLSALLQREALRSSRSATSSRWLPPRRTWA